MYLAFLQIHTRYIPRYRGGKELKILRTLYNSPHFWVKAEVKKLRSHDASVREPEPGPRRPPSRARSCRSPPTAPPQPLVAQPFVAQPLVVQPPVAQPPVAQPFKSYNCNDVSQFFRSRYIQIHMYLAFLQIHVSCIYHLGSSYVWIYRPRATYVPT